MAKACAIVFSVALPKAICMCTGRIMSSNVSNASSCRDRLWSGSPNAIKQVRSCHHVF